MRLDKAISMAGFSRSEAKAMISMGRVQVASAVARDPGMNVNPSDVLLDGSPVLIETELHLMIHKPAGVVTATEDRHAPTVVSLLPESMQKHKLGPVGRLDKDVTGLVLLTTDGQLAHRLISPRWKAEKLYRAECEGKLTKLDIALFASGLELSDFTAKPAKMEIISAGDVSVADVTLTEGKFHQVKRMFAAIGHPLISLKRLRIGCVELDESLEPGQFRRLTQEEIDGLKEMSGMK